MEMYTPVTQGKNRTASAAKASHKQATNNVVETALLDVTNAVEDVPVTVAKPVFPPSTGDKPIPTSPTAFTFDVPLTASGQAFTPAKDLLPGLRAPAPTPETGLVVAAELQLPPFEEVLTKSVRFSVRVTEQESPSPMAVTPVAPQSSGDAVQVTPEGPSGGAMLAFAGETPGARVLTQQLSMLDRTPHPAQFLSNAGNAAKYKKVLSQQVFTAQPMIASLNTAAAVTPEGRWEMQDRDEAAQLTPLSAPPQQETQAPPTYVKSKVECFTAINRALAEVATKQVHTEEAAARECASVRGAAAANASEDTGAVVLSESGTEPDDSEVESAPSKECSQSLSLAAAVAGLDIHSHAAEGPVHLEGLPTPAGKHVVFDDEGNALIKREGKGKQGAQERQSTGMSSAVKAPVAVLQGVPAPAGKHVVFDDEGNATVVREDGQLLLRGLPKPAGHKIRFAD